MLQARLCFRVRYQLSQSRCLSLLLILILILAMSSRVYLSHFLHAAVNLCPPSVTVSNHTSASNVVAFKSLAVPNVRMSLCMQSVHSFSFPPRPLRNAPSRFPNTIRFGSRPPLIRMSATVHTSLLVRNVVRMLSYWVISRARLYEVIR